MYTIFVRKPRVLDEIEQNMHNTDRKESVEITETIELTPEQYGAFYEKPKAAYPILPRQSKRDLRSRNTGLKPHILALADLAASVLMCRSVNMSEGRSILPRTDGSEKAKEHYIIRF